MAMEEEIRFTTNTTDVENGLNNIGKKIQEINNPQNEQQEPEKQSLVSVKDSMKLLTESIKELTGIIRDRNIFLTENTQDYKSLVSDSRVPQDKREINTNEQSNIVKNVQENEKIKEESSSRKVVQTEENNKGFMTDIQDLEEIAENAGSNILDFAGTAISEMGESIPVVGNALKGLTAAVSATAAASAVAISKLASRYEKDLPYTTQILSSFGTNITADAAANQTLADRMRSALVGYNRNTGLANNDFLDYASTLSRFGIGAGQEIKAGEMTQKAANLALLTNGDIGQNLDFMGLIERFGGNGIETINQVYNAAKLQGLDKNQFPEFLSNLQRVIEDGISKGYIKSTKEVATDLAIFSTLGQGNVFFEGEYGAKTYAQMSSGLANSTNLNSTSSFLVFRAAQDTIDAIGIADALNTSNKGGSLNSIKDVGASWLNTMAYIESGPLNSDFLKNLSSQVNSTYGNDTASKVLTYKEAFGLNYQGAIRVFNLLEELSSAESAGQIEKIKAQMEEVTSIPEFKNSETSLADAVSKLDDTIHGISKSAFDIKSAALDTIADSVDAIENWLLPDSRDMQRYGLNYEGLKTIREETGMNEAGSKYVGWDLLTTYIANAENIGDYSTPERAAYNLALDWVKTGKANNDIYKQGQAGGASDLIEMEYKFFTELLALVGYNEYGVSLGQGSGGTVAAVPDSTKIDKLLADLEALIEATNKAAESYNKELTVTQQGG